MSSVLPPLSLDTEGSQIIFEFTLQADEDRRPLNAHKNNSSSLSMREGIRPVQRHIKGRNPVREFVQSQCNGTHLNLTYMAQEL